MPWTRTHHNGKFAESWAVPAHGKKGFDDKRPGREPGPRHCCGRRKEDQKSIPPIPPGPPGGMAGCCCFFGTSATIASVVIRRPATELASCRAQRTTLVGSMMPLETILTYSPVWASKPKAY